MTARSIPDGRDASGGVPPAPGCGPVGAPSGTSACGSRWSPTSTTSSPSPSRGLCSPPPHAAFASRVRPHLVPALRGTAAASMRQRVAGDSLVGLAAVRPHRHRLGPRSRAPLLVSAGTEHGDWGARSSARPLPVADALVDHLATLTDGAPW